MLQTTLSAHWFGLSLFVAMLVCLEIGRRVSGVRQAGGPPTGAGALEGAIFALLGLLIAFTFSGAFDRFNARRAQIATEANAIGTAWLRLDLLPAGDQPALRDLFRRYLDARIETYASMPDVTAALKANDRANGLQNEIWQAAARSVQQPGVPPLAAMLVVPALNDMIDITTTRFMAAQMHPPLLIWGLLFILALGCAFLGGYAMGSAPRRWTYVVGFPALVAVAVFVTLELEYPRQGFVNLRAFDQVMVDLRASMK